LKRNFRSYEKFLTNHNTTFYNCFVDLSTTAAAFVGRIVHQVSLRRTVSNHRCVEVGRTRRVGRSTCLVLSWCVSFLWFTVPSCCFLCQSLWRDCSLCRGSKRWRGLWLPTCFPLLLWFYWCFVRKTGRSGKWYTSGKNKTRGPINLHTSMIAYCLLQRHLVDSRSNEGSSSCRNVNKNNYKRLYFEKFFI